jgi:hypothetical protein
MAITANVNLGNGVTASSCYIIIPTVYVKNFDGVDSEGNPYGFKLIYDVLIYKDATDRATNETSKQIKCREVDHHKIDYDITTSDNPFKLAYADLKTNSSLSSVSDA